MTSQPKTEKAPAKPTDAERVKLAIDAGKASIAKGETKADAARAIHALIKRDPREIIVSALIDGAGLTPKGAMTYYYNLLRKSQQGNGKSTKPTTPPPTDSVAKI